MALFTQTEVDDMLDKDKNPFRQDVGGTDSINILANSETKLLINGLARNSSSGPAYMTDRWDTVTSIMKAITEYDGPT